MIIIFCGELPDSNLKREGDLMGKQVEILCEKAQLEVSDILEKLDEIINNKDITTAEKTRKLRQLGLSYSEIADKLIINRVTIQQKN